MNTRLVGLLLVLGWVLPGLVRAAEPDSPDGADGQRGRRVLDEMYDASVAQLPDADRARLYECALKGPDGVNVAFAGFGPDGYGPEQWPLPIRVPMLYEMPMPFKLSGIPGEADAALYVVLTPKVLPLDRIAMLRAAKPALTMTKADLAAALSGKDVTKILVLPGQESEQTVKPGLEMVTSADLDPKADLVAAAS